MILAQELDLYLSNIKKQNLRQIDVIARAIPLQKYNVVKALQAQGEIVAVTGDGVNDVPALKVADIGIAMGERGTQSAREVSDIVLLDDNFGSIANAISEGRQLFTNLKICFKYLLMIHFPFVFSAALIPLLGYPLLYYPIHIVFIELIIHPTSLLVFQDLSPMKDLRTAKNNFFSPADLITIILSGLVTTTLVCLAFIVSLERGESTDYARALALAILSFMSVAITLGLSEIKIKITRTVVLIIVIVTILLIQLPVVSSLFGLKPLYLSGWITAFIAAFVTWVLTKFSYSSKK